MDEFSSGELAPQAECYEPPTVTEVGLLAEVTKGQYSVGQSDDSDAGGYWSP